MTSRWPAFDACKDLALLEQSIPVLRIMQAHGITGITYHNPEGIQETNSIDLMISEIEKHRERS